MDQTFLSFFQEHAAALQQKTFEHLTLASLSLALASFLAIPLGIFITRNSFFRKVLLNAGCVSQTIPSLAMLAFLVPILGLGTLPTLVVLTFYATYPILRSTYTGFQNVPLECTEAADVLGFSTFQKIWFVELPLAFPVMISGLRIATASTIGIATIAAFIGAGGLGDFITQGLSLNDTSLILLGAIPIALLALGFDFGISQIEKQLFRRKEQPFPFFRLKKTLLGFLGFCVLAIGFLSFSKDMFQSKENAIVIACKNFTEQYILAELMAQLIEAKTKLRVTRKYNVGTTELLHKALLSGAIDIYPEYTGTAYLTILHEPFINGDLFEKVKKSYLEKYNILWLKPFGFSNSQALAIKKELAERYKIKNVSDLELYSKNFIIAAPPEFIKRPDAFPGLSKVYALHFKKIIQVDPNLMYSALNHNSVDLIAAFTTDGKLIHCDFVLLKDDKKFYPSYQATPLIRKATLEAHPEIQKALDPLLGSINEKEMSALNYKVDVEGISPEKAAQEFLMKFKFL